MNRNLPADARIFTGDGSANTRTRTRAVDTTTGIAGSGGVHAAAAAVAITATQRRFRTAPHRSSECPPRKARVTFTPWHARKAQRKAERPAVAAAGGLSP